MSSSVAAKKVGSNQDLLIQIIICLPLKSVLRFKSLSKPFMYLIKELEPQLRRRREHIHGIFLRMIPEKNQYTWFRDGSMEDHMHQYIPLNPIKNRPFSTKSTPEKQPNFPSCPHVDNEIIVLSSNGLFLCFNLDSRRFIVFNTTTLSYTIIPDHKVCYTFPSKVLLYRNGIITGLRYNMLKNGVYWNGCVHWISDRLNESTRRRNITRFHIDTRTIDEIDGPQERNQYIFKCKNYYFGETCGHLHYIESGINTVMDIYEMKTDYSEWFVKYKINLAKEINNSRFRDNPYSFDLISVVRFEDEEERSGVLVLWVGNKVIKCNLVNRKIKTLAKFWNGYKPAGPVNYKPKRLCKDVAKFADPAFGLQNAFPFIPTLSDT